ncbi:AAA domain-containing protein [Helicobacter sp. MIT 01-3238]|uniref:AAA domain-containing protein n=1 Tax=Helicobacter sp. MIT 01-3238 TaxID=398627 RepID=UPI0028695A70|nr:AAA domain-containing protein [Helicobacter sp. MIT 01-3238]
MLKNKAKFCPPPPHNISSINYFNKSLTPDQKETISKALSSPTPIYLIQGPPGTGKTTVIAELIAQYTAQGKKIWLTSQSNLAVDNVLERLPKDERIFPTRIGSEDKIQDKLFANDSQVIDYFIYQYRGKIREFIDTYGKNIDKYISTYNEFIHIDKDLHKLESSITSARQEQDTVIQSSFFAYIDTVCKDLNSANLSILRSISKSMLKEQCERFHKFLCEQSQQKYSFLGKYASSDEPNEPNQQWQTLWEKGEEARNKEIHTLMQSCIGDTPPNIIKQFMRENHINANTVNTKEQAQKLQDKIQDKLKEQMQKRDALAKRKDSIQSTLEEIAKKLDFDKNTHSQNTTQNTHSELKAHIKHLQEKLAIYKKLDSLEMPSKESTFQTIAQKLNQKLGLDITKEMLEKMQKGFATNATTNEKELKKILRDIDIAKENKQNISEQELEAIANEILQSKQGAKASENCTRYANVMEGIKICANVYAATCNIDPRKLSIMQDEKETPIIFDVVIVDEVSKMNAIEMLLPMQRAKRLILVGDQHQLPPIFKEGIQREEIKEMLDISDEMFDRYKNLIEYSKFTQFFEIFPDSAKSRLTTQFRMHPHIMEFINHFYNDKRLQCGLPNPDETRAHEFGELYGIEHRHILWIDSSTSCEDAPEHSTSKRNMREVEVIRKIIKDMASVYKAHKTKHNLAQSKRKEIGVISFYGAQVGELRNIRKDKDYSKDLDIDISTVDDFQGKEKDVIIVSLVRTDKGISHNRFIKDYRRVNVAFSRARQLLIVIACNEAFDRVQLSFGDKETKLGYQKMRQSQKCFVVNKKLKDIIHYKSSDYASTDKPHKG